MAKSRRVSPARKRKPASVAPDARKTAPTKAKRKSVAKKKPKQKSTPETKRVRKPPAVIVATPIEEAPAFEPATFSPASTMREALAQLELAAALARNEASAPVFELAIEEPPPLEEAPLFDPPDDAAWVLDSVSEIAEPEPVPESVPAPVAEIIATAPPPFDLDTPAPQQGPRVSAEDRRETLRRARLAAQAHGEQLQQQQAKLRARVFGGGVYGIGIGVAAFAAIGAALLLQSGGETAAPLAPAAQAATLTAAPAPEPQQAAPDHVAAYAAALRLIDEGRAEAGVRQLQRAAEAGSAPAQYRLSKHYERGEGAPQSLALALQWAERAAEAGNVRAMHDVGVFYARGELGIPDEAAAFRWFRQAADYGVADSQYNLGVLYLQGRGIAADPREALFWFLVAAHNEDTNAIDRAVSVAATLTPSEVTQMRDRARAFQPRAPNAEANAPQA